MSKKVDNGPDKFEMCLANGKIRSFNTGYDMWKWAAQTNPRMEFFSRDDEQQPISLSEWFERRNSK